MLALCVSQTWVNPPTAELDANSDTALLLPPSETAPMSRSQQVAKHYDTVRSSVSSADEQLEDLYLTEASAGHRVVMGTI